jgi:hypothetical protein
MVGWKTGECVDAGEGQDGSSALAPRKMSKINKAKSTKHAMYLEKQKGYEERISFYRAERGCKTGRHLIMGRHVN